MEQLTGEDLAKIRERWQLALEYLAAIQMDHLPEEHAIRVLVRSDLPRLIRELTRLEPELGDADCKAADDAGG
jgi:hypothetical protein